MDDFASSGFCVSLVGVNVSLWMWDFFIKLGKYLCWRKFDFASSYIFIHSPLFYRALIGLDNEIVKWKIPWGTLFHPFVKMPVR